MSDRGRGGTVTMAKVLGFCGGVRRAVRRIEEELRDHGPLYTLGAIVHNAHVVDGLAAKGAKMVTGLSEVPDGGTVAITAHGAGEEIYAEIERRGLRLVDTTCPIVRKAQETVARLVEEGFAVILYGESEHPEVRGILSWTRGRGIATQSADVEIEPGPAGVAAIAQTTKSPRHFGAFAKEITLRYSDRVADIKNVDTTCPETGRRYEAAKSLAATVDLVLVVGSRTSANTRKLVETVRETGVLTYHIESSDEIEEEWIPEGAAVGVTAGASTPDEVIGDVVRALRAQDGTLAGAQEGDEKGAAE